MNIINTIAEVFKVSLEEFNSMLLFIRSEKRKTFRPSMLVIEAGIAADTEADTGNSSFPENGQR